MSKKKHILLIFLIITVYSANGICESSFRLGIDRIAEYRSFFSGKRVGLITNQTGINAEGVSSIDIVKKHAQLVCLLSPEHGLYGYAREGALISDTTESSGAIPVYSLYGKTKRPSKEILDTIDILCFDIQDVGARFYTYIYTMAYAMEECARYNKSFVVFDRPNPINGTAVEGNILELEYRSFTGYFPIVQRHGMTVGELALLFNTEYGINCALTVIPMKHWDRKAYFDELPLIWVPPSPNIPSPQTALLYVGVCLFEGTNVSVGRGTAMPFYYLGAPFINGKELADRLNERALAGVRFLPAVFEPSLSLYKQKLCNGIHIAVTCREQFEPVKTALHIFYQLKKLYPADFKINNEGKKYCGLHLLTGCTYLTDSSKTAEDYFHRIERESAAFRKIRQKYLLY